MHADRAETGVKKCIRFSNLSRQLWIKIPAQERFFEWRESIERTLTSYPGISYLNHKPIISNDIKIHYEFIQPIYIQYASYQFDRTRLHHTKPPWFICTCKEKSKSLLVCRRRLSDVCRCRCDRKGINQEFFYFIEDFWILLR